MDLTNKNYIIKRIIFVLIFSVISIYFWVVVFCAARSWAKQRREERENASTSTLSSGNETINDENYTTQLPQKGVVQV